MPHISFSPTQIGSNDKMAVVPGTEVWPLRMSLQVNKSEVSSGNRGPGLSEHKRHFLVEQNYVLRYEILVRGNFISGEQYCIEVLPASQSDAHKMPFRGDVLGSVRIMAQTSAIGLSFSISRSHLPACDGFENFTVKLDSTAIRLWIDGEVPSVEKDVSNLELGLIVKKKMPTEMRKRSRRELDMNGIQAETAETDLTVQFAVHLRRTFCQTEGVPLRTPQSLQRPRLDALIDQIGDVRLLGQVIHPFTKSRCYLYGLSLRGSL